MSMAIKKRYRWRRTTWNAPTGFKGSSNRRIRTVSPSRRWIQFVSSIQTASKTAVTSIITYDPTDTKSRLATAAPKMAPSELPIPTIAKSRFPCS